LLDRNKDNNTKYINDKLTQDSLKLLKSKNKFLWFDFCGNPSVDSLKLLNSSFVKGEKTCAIFTFTLLWRRRDNLPVEIDFLSKSSSNEEAVEIYFKQAIKDLNANIEGYSNKIHLLWKYSYVSSRAPMICLCVTNDPALKEERSLRGQGELLKPDQEITPAAEIKGDLDAGEEMIQKMKTSKRSLAAHKAWVTIRANKARAVLSVA
jgi:hypothetical protein